MTDLLLTVVFDNGVKQVKNCGPLDWSDTYDLKLEISKCFIDRKLFLQRELGIDFGRVVFFSFTRLEKKGWFS